MAFDAPIDVDTLSRWRAHALDARVTDQLRAVYQLCADAIEARGPACWASGRCCRFEGAGHRLYCTGLEVAYCLSRSPAPTRAQLHASRQGDGGCPYQALNLCTVHLAKPLGCRIYFCDRTSDAWQHALYERLQAQLQDLHRRHGIDYIYAEWRTLLEAFADHPGDGATPVAGARM